MACLTIHARERLIAIARRSIRFRVRASIGILLVFSLAAICVNDIASYAGIKDSRPAGAGGSDRGGVGGVLRDDKAAVKHHLHMREAADELDGPGKLAGQHDVAMAPGARMAEAH